MLQGPNLCASRLPHAENIALDSASNHPAEQDSSGNEPFLQARPCNTFPNLSLDPLTYTAVSLESRSETAAPQLAAATLTFRSESRIQCSANLL